MSTEGSVLSESCSGFNDMEYSAVLKRKCREIGQTSPSMMWKRSIVQALGGSGRWARAAGLALALAVLGSTLPTVQSADLVIEIPGSAGDAEPDSGHYRLDYWPPQGDPPPNHTVAAQASKINFVGLPGTKYHFMLYYSNATFPDLLTWNQTIITAPEPPTNLTVTLGRNKVATISWSPPERGQYTGFKFKVIPLTERADGGPRTFTVDSSGNWTYQLRDLSPGATYQLHAFTLLHDKESAAYASRNFTTKPNTPGKFIVWFRNETTLLVLWQPPYPPGAYTHYKVSILPPDARDSELYVEKEGEPPGPAQAAFKGLVPGRAYNISVQTVSEPEISAPTTAQYRTVPLRPRNVTAPQELLQETSFTVTWLPPLEESEFEKYQVSVTGTGSGARRLAPVVRSRNETPSCSFEGLEPGAPYTVIVKTMSGKVTSWPATTELTLKPLPVRKLQARNAEGTEGVVVTWQPAEGSTQDSYRVSYHEAGPSHEDSNTLETSDTSVTLTTLQPGRNYTLSVSAVSGGVQSNRSVSWAGTRPLAPVASAVQLERALQLAWLTDVTSRQDTYELRYRRVDKTQPPHAFIKRETHETHAELTDLFPGAVYEIQLTAISNGLRSEPRRLLKPVRPLAPVWLRVERATSNSARAVWAAPAPAASALGGLALRYQPRHAHAPAPAPPPVLLPATATVYEITNMTHGEHYIIELDTLSEDAEGESVASDHPKIAEHTVRPNPVTNVLTLVDSRNITLEWPAPGGRVEHYSLRWAREGGAPASRTVPRHPLTVRASIPGLDPGAKYRLALTAHSYNLSSDEFTIDTRTRPLIQSEMTIGSDGDDNETSTTLRVIYTRTPESATLFDSYRFRLEGAGEAPRLVSRNTSESQPVFFDGLQPGRLYNVTMWTVSHNVTSHPVQRTARLRPRPIPWLNATEVGARHISLAWAKPMGDYTDFLLQYLDPPPEDTHSAEHLKTLVTDQLHIKVDDLRPYTNYTMTVTVRSGDAGSPRELSRELSREFRTRQAPPPAPEAFAPTDTAPSKLSFSWVLDERRANGKLLGFELQYAPQNEPDKITTLHFDAEARSGSVSGLAPGATYSLWLRARTGAGAGAAAHWTQRMRIAAPPAPAPGALPAELRRTTTTVAVRFQADYFSPVNGNVTAYTLVLSEQRDAPAPARLPSWRDVHGLPVWPPYQVTEPYYPFRESAVEEFTIGSERCDTGGRVYCNGPLKPGTRYYVKLRAFTAPDKFTDTAYSQIYTEVDNTAWIAGACVALCAAAGAGAALALRRRRARAAPAAPPPLQPRASRPVRVHDFIDHYRLMAADSDFRFSEEFEELKHVGREQPCTAADLPVNRPKNRFTNILPYDHSRYKLQPVDDEEGSDYINANYVPGHNSPREFIVTQGPLHCTRDDFWRMCWESGSRAIVMLTRCVEKGREKCDRYWPYDTRPVYYGDIAVTALNESRYPDWTVTELALSRAAEQRVIKHFHFTTWPDFGVPDPPTTLARFVRAFRERCPPDARPVVVHCSAGVGRSGTFITLDTALQQLANHAEYIDIFGMVYAMRRERVWMVQTEQQYICIHQCLVAVLEGQDLQPPHTTHAHHLNQAFEDDEGIAESGM